MGVLGLATLALALLAPGGWRAPVMLPLLALAGCGHGAAYGPLVHELTGRLRRDQVSALSGLVPTVTQVAGALGIVVMGGIYLAAAGRGLPAQGLSLVGAALTAVALVTLPAAIRVALGAQSSGLSERAVDTGSHLLTPPCRRPQCQAPTAIGEDQSAEGETGGEGGGGGGTSSRGGLGQSGQ
jgi:hypothetical protein